MFKVVIKRVADGQKRIYYEHSHVFHPHGNKFWWTEGNGSCACNRKSMFDEAADPDADDGPEACPCGDTEYSIVEFRDENNNVIELTDREIT